MANLFLRYFSLPGNIEDDAVERQVRQLHPMLITGALAAFIFPLLSYIQDGRVIGLIVGWGALAAMLVLFNFLHQGRVKIVAGTLVLVANAAAIWRLLVISGIQHSLVTILMVLLIITRIFLGERPLWYITGFNVFALLIIYLAQRSNLLIGDYPPPPVDSLILFFVSFFTLAYYLNITVGSLERYAAASRRQSASLQRSEAELLNVKENLEELVEERTAALIESNQALSAAKESAEAANRAKSAFLANMSHELRTPLHTILGYSTMLREQLLDQEPLEPQDLEQIEMAGNHLLELINEILDLSKVEANMNQQIFSKFMLAELLEEIKYQMRPLFAESSNQLIIEADHAAPEMYSDRTKIKQILFNLLNNSLKFTENGIVTLRVTEVMTASEAPGVCFEVEDTGIGISPNHQARLFEPFYQVDNSFSRRYQGTGLGLTLCQRFTELLGGQISVSSQLGAGSIFRVELPLQLEPQPETAVG